MDYLQTRGSDDVAPRGLRTLEGAKCHHHLQIRGSVKRRRRIRDDGLMNQDT